MPLIVHPLSSSKEAAGIAFALPAVLMSACCAPQNKRVAFDFDKLRLKVGPLQKTFTIKDKPIDLQCAPRVPACLVSASPCTAVATVTALSPPWPAYACYGHNEYHTRGRACRPSLCCVQTPIAPQSCLLGLCKQCSVCSKPLHATKQKSANVLLGYNLGRTNPDVPSCAHRRAGR